MWGKRGTALAVGAVVAVAAGGATAIRAQQQRAELQRQCQQIEANAKAAPHSVPGATRAVILGDSYTSGFTLPDPSQGYAYLAAKRLGWAATVDGWAGSGYVNGSACGGHTFLTRAEHIPAGTRVALIEGGLNDLDHLNQLPGAARRVIAAAKTHAARVVVLGPPLAPARDPRKVRRADADLAAAAKAEGVRYVSTLSWPVQVGPDRLHPTPAGASDFAARVGSALTAG